VKHPGESSRVRCSEGHLPYRQMDRPDKANCTSGPQEPYGYQGLPKGSVRLGYQGNQAKYPWSKGETGLVWKGYLPGNRGNRIVRGWKSWGSP